MILYDKMYLSHKTHNMPESLSAPAPANIDPQSRIADPALPQAAGGVALAEAVSDETTTMVNGREYATNLPVGLDVFEAADYGLDRLEEAPLAPSKLDTIPVGRFSVSGTEEQADEFLTKKPVAVSRMIVARETDKGKVIELESFGSEAYDWRLQPDTSELMTALGYVIARNEAGYDTIAAVPTPETVKKAAADHGVQVEFFPEHGYVPGSKYLTAFKEGKYPASSGKSVQYKHDIEDDHLTAMVLGGEPLKEALSVAATAALETNDGSTIDTMSQSIDIFTATLRAVISSHSQLLGEAYGKESGRRTLKECGEACGIAPEVTAQILATAQAKAHTFNMPVRELD